jgi:hypothetical protein
MVLSPELKKNIEIYVKSLLPELIEEINVDRLRDLRERERKLLVDEPTKTTESP